LARLLDTSLPQNRTIGSWTDIISEVAGDNRDAPVPVAEDAMIAGRADVPPSGVFEHLNQITNFDGHVALPFRATSITTRTNT